VRQDAPLQAQALPRLQRLAAEAVVVGEHDPVGAREPGMARVLRVGVERNTGRALAQLAPVVDPVGFLVERVRLAAPTAIVDQRAAVAFVEHVEHADTKPRSHRPPAR
jgi:hypothetical protein